MSPHSRRASSASLTEPEQPRHIIHTLPRLTDRVKNLTSHHPHFTSSDRPCQEPDLTDTRHFTSSDRPCQEPDLTNTRHFTSSDRPCQEPDLTDTQMFIIRNKCLLLVVINGSWRLHRLNSVDVQSRSTDCFAMLHCFMSAAYNSAADTNCSVPVTYCCIHPFSVGLL